MKNIFSLFCFVSIVLSAIGINSFDTQAQTVLFSETFNEANNATTGTSAEGISWTATCPACVAGDYYHVVNGAMEGQDTNGAAEWITGNITVPMGTQFITLTTTYNSIGYAGNGNLESQDECGSCPCDPSVVTTNGSCNNCWDYVAYTVSSGGSTVGNDILLGCAGTADDGSLCQPLDVSSLTASGPATITMEVEMAMWASSEKLSFDDVIITAYTPAQATAAGVTAGSCPAPPICDLTLGAAAITCNAYTSGTSDAVTINVPYTGMDPDAVLSILVNGSAASNIGSNPAVTANGTITFAATEGATYSVGFTDATCNLQSLSGTVSTTQCLAGCSVNIASVTPTCNGTNYDLAVTFTHSSPISTAAANITVKDGATTLASQSNVTTTGSSQTVNFTNVAVGNTTPGITVTVADVNSGGGGTCSPIFISEYVEGSSSNRCIELYNQTSSAIVLDAVGAVYTLARYDNGGTTAVSIALIGTIPANGTFVICNTSATGTITRQQNSGALTYTGNDVIALRFNGTNIDVIGQIGNDPGSAGWGTDPTNTTDNTIRRKSTITTGDSDGSNAFNPATEWDGFLLDNFTGLGSHTYTGSCGPACEATATFTEPDCSICTNPPTVAPEGPYTTCVGDAKLLGDAAFGGSATMAQWSITAAAGGATIADGTLSNTAMTATPAAVTFTGAVAGTYTLTLTSNNPLGAPCTAASLTTTVNVIADQVGTLSYPKATYCANEADPTPTVTGGSTDDEFTSTTGLVIDASTGVIDLSASTPGTYTITYRTSLSAACPGFATFSITINAAPTAGITIAETSGTANDGTVCAGSAITLTATGGTSYNWTLPDASTSTTNPQSIASAIAADAGTYTVAVTNAAGCTATTTTAVVVNALPTAGITIAETSGTANDGTVCAGSAITLTATGGTSYNWTLPDASTSTTNPQSIASAVAANAGTYTVAVTNAAGCTATTTTAVVVNALPTAGITIAETSGTANDGTVCAGSAITLTATGGTSYNWTLPDASTSTTNPQSIASAIAADAGTYTVAVTNAAGCTATTTTAVVVNALPTAGITIAETSGTANDGTVCAGSAITLTATGGTSYNWTLPDASTSTTNPQSIASAVAANAGTYTVAVTNAAGCTATTTTAVVVNALPTAGITIAETSGTANDGTVCAGSAITLTATGGTSYNWTLPDASTSTTNPQSIASAVAANAGTYTVAVTNAAGCTATTTTAVVVNALPTAGITIAETSGTANDGTVCAGSAITLTATGGTSYNWTLPDASTSTTNPQSIASAVAADAGTYTVAVTNAAGCTATTTTAVVVNALPTAGITIAETSGTANDGTVCAGSAITLTATGGTSYNWTLPDASTSTTNPQSIASAVAANAGTYTVAVTNAAGCTATTTTAVVVNALPTAGITIAETSGTANDGTVCAGSAITLTATGGTSYNWTLPDASTSTTNPQSIASAVAADAGTYTVAVTNAAGCTATTTTAVVVNNIPTFTGTASCSGGTNTGSISQTATGGSGSYTYGITGGSFGPTLANNTYTVTVISNGCSSTAEVIVNCSACAVPTPTVVKSGNLSCTVSSITLSISGLVAGPAYTYQWTGGSTNATLNVSAQGTYTVTVTNPSNGGCTATSSLTVARRCTAITDPCSCVNDASSPVGAAPNDGHFNEVIAIWNDLNANGDIDSGEDLLQSGPGEIAYITTQTGMLNLSNVAYPTSPAFGVVSLTFGNIPATLNADGSIATLSGVMGYYLIFRHTDAAGYTANVTIDEDGNSMTTGDQFPEPTMAATCFYPNPTFSPVLTSPLCTTDAAITLGSNPSGASFTINSIAATSFNPATLGTTPNPHVVELTLDPAGNLGGATPAASGCIQAIKANVVVQNCVICMPNAGSW